MNHFLALSGDEKQGSLNETDSHHALRVLRLNAGDIISLSYGDGKIYEAIIKIAHKRSLDFEINKLIRVQEKPRLTIAISPTKSNDRFEWFLEKAVEMGIAEIIPIICDHSERRVYKTDRGMRIMESAFKQSHKGYFPTLREAITFKSFLQQSIPAQSFIATLTDDERIGFNDLEPKSPTLLMIGPEGDFSKVEISSALKSGLRPIHLGKEVLRTETAGVKAVAIYNFMNERNNGKS
jgi:16S rRNA (uracil1498-N3)-methyltransferase